MSWVGVTGNVEKGVGVEVGGNQTMVGVKVEVGGTGVEVGSGGKEVPRGMQAEITRASSSNPPGGKTGE